MIAGAKNKVAQKTFSLAKSPVGDLVVGLAFGKFSKFLLVTKVNQLHFHLHSGTRLK